MSRMAYFDCINGAAGDMIIGALLDAGGDFGKLQESLKKFGVHGYELTADRVLKNGIAATQFDVVIKGGEGHSHRHLSDIQDIIHSSSLSSKVKTQAAEVFSRLAQAESRVHGCSAEEVHFHEVGAIDAIIDVVGTCLLLEQLDIDRVFVSSFPLGRGTVRSEHGWLPVPVPAVQFLLEGFTVFDNGEAGELVTPTGAALLTTLAHGGTSSPPMTLLCSGFGSGKRNHERMPNVIRVLIGEEEPSVKDLQTEWLRVLEANIDDQTSQQIAYLGETLFTLGALDVWTTAIYMKKSRSALTLHVLFAPEKEQAILAKLFSESTTLGVRIQSVSRLSVPREISSVDTPWGPVRVKIAYGEGGVSNLMPEYEDCAAIARRTGVALKEVQQRALELARERVAGKAGSSSR